MPDLLAVAEAELQEVERKLSELQALTQRRDQLRSFIAIGRSLYAAPEGQSSLIAEASPYVSEAPRETPKHDTVKARVVEATVALLAAEGPMRTRDILARLQAQGIEIGGANKLDTVSVILSRTKERFKPDRAIGWSLVDGQKEVTPPVAPTTAGS